MCMRRLLLPAVMVASVYGPTPVEAQDCGRWNRPVLCTAELVVNADTGYGNQPLEPRARLALAPQETVELQLNGRDQTGRIFPPERMSLAFDALDCRRFVQVEDVGEGLLRLEAVASDGRCRLDVWTPNNTNFSWALEITIEVPERVGYDRREAEILANALYRAVLGREADAGGLRGAVDEIQRGNLDSQVDAMVRSQEFRQSITGLSPEQLLDRFYDGILLRQSDLAGDQLYLPNIRRGNYAPVLLALITLRRRPGKP